MKRTKQVILANRQEAASVSVHERVLRSETLAICTRKRAQPLAFEDYIYENESQQFLIKPLFRKLSKSGCTQKNFKNDKVLLECISDIKVKSSHFLTGFSL